MWAGQPVTVESRGGKSWGAKVGQLVRVEKDGAVGVYTDAKSHDRAVEAGVVAMVATPPGVPAGVGDNAPAQAGHKVATVEPDDIYAARRIIVRALTALTLLDDGIDSAISYSSPLIPSSSRVSAVSARTIIRRLA